MAAHRTNALRRRQADSPLSKEPENTMRRVLSTIAVLLTVAPLAWAQPGLLTRQHLIEYTPDWKGERFPDGRPKVPDAILDRMKHVTLEEAWAVVTSAGFSHQYEDSWVSIHPGQVLVGRALTSQWLPGRPDILRSEEHTSELQSQSNLVCRLLLEKKKKNNTNQTYRT